MKSMLIASAFALGSTLALAQTQTPSTSQERAATPSKANSQLGAHASEYWSKSSKGGYMTREQTMGYQTPDGQPYMKGGKAMEFSQIDADGDGRVSQKEWGTYHGMSESGGSRSGATGATSGSTSNSGATGGQSTGSGATGSGTTAPADGARSGSTPRN